MNAQEAIKGARITFWVQATMAAALATLFATGIIGSSEITISDTNRYIAEVAGVAFTIIAIPLAIKGFSAQMRRAAERKTDHFIEYYHSKCNARTSILFVATVMNIAIYFILDNNSALYCTLLCIAAAIYSYPTQATLDNYHNNREEKE